MPPQHLHRPFYTPEMLRNIEESLLAAKSVRLLRLLDIGGRAKLIQFPCPTVPSHLAQGNTEQRATVTFYDETQFLLGPVFVPSSRFISLSAEYRQFRLPNQSEKRTRARLHDAVGLFKESSEAHEIKTFIRNAGAMRVRMNRVVAFGLGCISFVHPEAAEYDAVGRCLASLYQHAAAIVVAQAVSTTTPVPILVQDPAYTDVCKRVLRSFSLEVIDGFGAKGFSMINNRTIVLGHRPDFPLRSLIADLARPALICMKAERPSGVEELNVDLGKDPDTPRSRAMLKGYRKVTLPLQEKSVFWDNVWFVKKDGSFYTRFLELQEKKKAINKYKEGQKDSRENKSSSSDPSSDKIVIEISD
ncbi:hypothetical protein F4777DRAFT_598746 [Nemania sp. FL0916]|nr:hypothetical protein F4777DRAFT_598746 [Nemania sp. FL0916]